MARQLPLLNALRTFEAAGRHVSFIHAAEELSVTPGAVSRQVRCCSNGSVRSYLGGLTSRSP
ncbi:MAG: LysR family transcriptional regulator [Alphaproteobacteria bacterium]